MAGKTWGKTRIPVKECKATVCVEKEVKDGEEKVG